MTDTPNLGLPFIEGSQAQKHVTHNEALRRLDAAIHIAVLDRSRAAPPATPAAGERHVVAAGASGDWAGRDGAIATWQDGAWSYLAPKAGWCAWSEADGAIFVHDGAAWREATSLDNVSRLGVNATAAAPNLLSVRSNDALFNAIAAADGGTGDMRLQIAKETAAGAASVIFSRAFSGRAFLTMQKAIDVVYGALDLGGFDVTIQCGAGAYAGGVSVTAAQVGKGDIYLLGDPAAPGNVVIAATGADCVGITAAATLTVRGFRLQTSTSGYCLYACGGGARINYGNIDFGPAAGGHVRAVSGGCCGNVAIGNCTISGSAPSHYTTGNAGIIELSSHSVTVAGAPVFSSAFARAVSGGLISAVAVSFSGAASGPYYSATLNGIINTFGAGTSYFPGSSAGSTATGGQYA